MGRQTRGTLRKSRMKSRESRDIRELSAFLGAHCGCKDPEEYLDEKSLQEAILTSCLGVLRPSLSTEVHELWRFEV